MFGTQRSHADRRGAAASITANRPCSYQFLKQPAGRIWMRPVQPESLSIRHASEMPPRRRPSLHLKQIVVDAMVIPQPVALAGMSSHHRALPLEKLRHINYEVRHHRDAVSIFSLE